jgi:hypothetical protein
MLGIVEHNNAMSWALAGIGRFQLYGQTLSHLGYLTGEA